MDGDIRQRSTLGRPHAVLAQLEAEARSEGQDARYAHRLDRGNWDEPHADVIAKGWARWLSRQRWAPMQRAQERLRAAFAAGWAEND